MSLSRTLAAALAAALAVPAVAQTKVADEARRAAERRQSEQPPAAAPAPPAAGAAQTAQQQAQAQGEGARHQQLLQTLANVLAHNDLSVRVGDLAATRAATPELQNLGRQVAEDHRRVGEGLTRLLSERGIAVPAPTERDKIENEFMQLASVTGPEFDRHVTDFLTRNGPEFVESLKRARDLTPGKDGQLKKFLDDAENTEEAHLTSARQAKSQRQARTPPRQ